MDLGPKNSWIGVSNFIPENQPKFNIPKGFIEGRGFLNWFFKATYFFILQTSMGGLREKGVVRQDLPGNGKLGLGCWVF